MKNFTKKHEWIKHEKISNSVENLTELLGFVKITWSRGCLDYQTQYF